MSRSGLCDSSRRRVQKDPAYVLLIVLALSIAIGAQDKPAGRTVLDGVYTEAQAKRGEREYQARCERCHDGADVDGPMLTGAPFVDRWREDSLEPLFAFIKTRMPRDAPGSLSDAANADLLAHVLA